MNRKQFVKDYLSFTRKERIGLLAILLAIVIVIILPKMVEDKAGVQQIKADTSWISAVRSLEIKDSQNDYKANMIQRPAENQYTFQFDPTVNRSASSSVLFHFDPNTVDKDGWQRLGLTDKTIHTIQNYLNKGGHFYHSEDLKRIYGLHTSDYLRLEPYVRIEKITTENKPVEYVRNEKEHTPFIYKPIDINIADTTAFISLPGIGSKLATRIINFRDKLGGFYSITQVGEIYGLPDSTFQTIKPYLKLENTSVKKFNINTATVDELKTHPYMKYNIANPIVSYRNEHGSFSTLEDLKKVMAITEEVYHKITPYLTIQ